MSKKLFNEFLKFTGVAPKSDATQTNQTAANFAASPLDETVAIDSFVGIEMQFR